jgi:hypothetical protein
MGMFDKDKQFAPDGRLDEVYPPGNLDSREGATFVLWGVEDKGKFITDIGEADMTWLETSEVLDPETRKVVGTLSSPIAAKAKEAEESEFPCVVKTLQVSTDQQPALVLQWIREYDDGEGAPPKKK